MPLYDEQLFKMAQAKMASAEGLPPTQAGLAPVWAPPPTPWHDLVVKAARDMPSFTSQKRDPKSKEIYRALKRDHPGYSAGKKARIAQSAADKSKKASFVPRLVKMALGEPLVSGMGPGGAKPSLTPPAPALGKVGPRPQPLYTVRIGDPTGNTGNFAGMGPAPRPAVAKPMAPPGAMWRQQLQGPPGIGKEGTYPGCGSHMRYKTRKKGKRKASRK